MQTSLGCHLPSTQGEPALSLSFLIEAQLKYNQVRSPGKCLWRVIACVYWAPAPGVCPPSQPAPLPATCHMPDFIAITLLRLNLISVEPHTCPLPCWLLPLGVTSVMPVPMVGTAGCLPVPVQIPLCCVPWRAGPCLPNTQPVVPVVWTLRIRLHVHSLVGASGAPLFTRVPAPQEPRAVCTVVKASASWMEKLRHDMSLQVIHSPRVGIPAGSMCWRTKLFANGVAFHQQSGSGPTAAGSLLGQGHLLLLGRGAAGLSPTPLILPSLFKPSWVLTAVSSVPVLPAARESPANAVTNDCNLCVMWSLMPAAGREVLPLGNAIHAKAVMCVQPLPGSRAADPSS